MIEFKLLIMLITGYLLGVYTNRILFKRVFKIYTKEVYLQYKNKIKELQNELYKNETIKKQ